MIDDKEFRSISRENGGSQSLFGTAELHKNSQVVKIDNEKIQRDLQGVRDNSITSNVEHQINIVLDRESATITSTIGEPGTNNRSVISYYPAPATGVNFETPGGNIIIGQAHGHPASNEPGKTTLQTMSVGDDLDSGTSAKMGIPIYGVDAMSGKVGSSGGIHLVTPDGKITNNIGKTIGNGTAKGAGALNIGRQALEIWGKRK